MRNPNRGSIEPTLLALVGFPFVIYPDELGTETIRSNPSYLAQQYRWTQLVGVPARRNETTETTESPRPIAVAA